MDKHALARLVLTAAEETFATMLGWQVAYQQLSTENSERVVTSERVIALIGIAGCYNGTGIINSSPEMACQISSQLLMADFQTINSEVLDAMGEISNMIFGNVKTTLEEQVGLLGLSIPTVMFGRNFCTRSVGEQWIDVSLKLEEQDIELGLYLTQNHNKTEPSMIRQPIAISV